MGIFNFLTRLADGFGIPVDPRTLGIDGSGFVRVWSGSGVSGPRRCGGASYEG